MTNANIFTGYRAKADRVSAELQSIGFTVDDKRYDYLEDFVISASKKFSSGEEIHFFFEGNNGQMSLYRTHRSAEPIRKAVVKVFGTEFCPEIKGSFDEIANFVHKLYRGSF